MLTIPILGLAPNVRESQKTVGSMIPGRREQAVKLRDPSKELVLVPHTPRERSQPYLEVRSLPLALRAVQARSQSRSLRRGLSQDLHRSVQ